MRRVLAWIFLAMVGTGACVLLEQGSGELDRYKAEEIR